MKKVVLPLTWLIVGCALACGGKDSSEPVGGAGGTAEGGSSGRSGVGGAAGSAGSGGMGGASGASGAGSGGAGGMEAVVFPDAPYDTEGSSCDSSTSGTGLVRGRLDRTVPDLSERVALPRPSIGIGRENSGVGNVLVRHAGGYLVSGHNGFWAVDDELDAQRIPMPGHFINTFLLGDIDGDDDEDVVIVSDEYAGKQRHLIAWEHVAGEWQPRARIAAVELQLHQAFTLGDIDGDGDRDVVTFKDDAVVSFRNEGAFRFSTLEMEPEGAMGQLAMALKLYDADADGDLDLVAATYGDPFAPWLLGIAWATNDGTGTFAVSEQMQTELQVANVQLHDVTGDGVLDAVASAITTAANTLLRSVADPAQLTFEPMDEQAQLFDVIDLDGTGTPTLVLVSNDGIELQTTLADGSVQADAFAVTLLYSRGLVVSGTDAELSLAMIVTDSCPVPCTDACEVACFFDACIGCITNADCSAGVECVESHCGPIDAGVP